MLEANGIVRKTGESWLLNDIRLTVRASQRIALVGSSGSGKTLLLRALALLDPIDAGEIRWHGNVVLGNKVPLFRSQVVYLHQRPTLMEGTVQENLQQPFSFRVHRDKRFNRARIISLLNSLGRTETFLTKRQRELSGGEAQLAALLKAMQLDPDMLLLDEPTAALDSETTEMVESLVCCWFKEQPDARATIWVTHDAEQARRVSSAVFQVHDGRLDGSD